MTAEEFRDKYHVRDCDKHCGNCRHGTDLMCDGMYNCHHEKVDGGMFVYDGDVCDCWEKGYG